MMKRLEIGFTLAELLMALVIFGLLSAIAYPSYTKVLERMKVSQAIADIVLIDTMVERFRAVNGFLPDRLGQLKNAPVLDPWENPYQYLSFDGNPPIFSARQK